MMKKIKNCIGLPFKGKIGEQTRAILLVTNVMIGCAALFSITVLILFFSRQRYRFESETFSYISGELYSSLKDSEVLVRMMAFDSGLTDLLMELRGLPEASEESQRTMESIRESVANYCNSNHYISYVNIWQSSSAADSFDDKVVRFSRYAPASEMLNREQRGQLASNALDHSGFGCWTFLEGDREGVYYVRLIRTIKEYQFINLGYVAVRVNLQRLINDLAASDEGYGHKIIMLGREKELTLSSSGNLEPLDTVYEQMYDSREEYQIIRTGKHWYFIVATYIPSLNMLCCYMVLYDQPYFMVIWAYVIFIPGMLLVLAAALMISGKVMRQITRHFDTLYCKMQVYSRGELAPLDVGFDYTGGTDELSKAHVQLDNMAVRIQNLIDDNYIKQLRIQEAAFKALEQQINPHFLYNTLFTIQWKAVAAGQTEISQMVCSLGNIMRFSLGSEDTVTVKDEMAIIQDYMTIQKLRYQERLAWKVQVEEQSLQLKIPKMTIQPLVENAVKYGLEQSLDDVCTVEIRVWEAEDSFTVEVRNNGSAFEEGLLDKLRMGQVESNGLGIGMLNIDERIRLLCGRQYGLQINNEQGYAVVRAVLSKRIPAPAKGEKYVEDHSGG
ncbi:MAG: histidine kinase [Oscillospiraceae bacterium]|jgi:two-component system sensor histidine kinase YesM|nr:histidine kinase [Oscillospiraceae bacterium]